MKDVYVVIQQTVDTTEGITTGLKAMCYTSTEAVAKAEVEELKKNDKGYDLDRYECERVHYMYLKASPWE